MTRKWRLNREDLGQALEDGCEVHGLNSSETAAVHLLVANGLWLRRGELRRHIETHQDPETGLTAWIDWSNLVGECDESPASSGELALLRLACQLAGHLPEAAHEDWSLGLILLRLDATTAMMASRATAMAALGKTVVRSIR